MILLAMLVFVVEYSHHVIRAPGHQSKEQICTRITSL
uniref:Uncharacterized protein n=1 Tax=Rhizophora mucronata TaxID=61149 RepID=A0A2P2QYC4_RHIMU